MRNTMSVLVAIATLVSLEGMAGCNNQAQSVNQEPSMPIDSRRPFIAFSQRAMYLSQLEIPVAIPVVVGSTSSRDVLAVDRQDIVSIDEKGSLRPHKNGSAVVRAPDGSQLQVVIHAVRSMHLLHEQIQLTTDSRASVEVQDESNQAVPALQIEWNTSDPSIAVVANGELKSGSHSGRAILSGSCGDAIVKLTAVVSQSQAHNMKRARDSVAELGTIFTVESIRPASATASFTSSNPTVLAPLGKGFFWAKALGRAELCSNSSVRLCAIAEVVK